MRDHFSRSMRPAAVVSGNIGAGKTMLTNSAFDNSEPDGDAATLATGIGICEAREGLAAINNPGKELVIWRRAFHSDVTTWLERLDASRLPDVRILIRPGDFRRAMEPLLDDRGMPRQDMRDLLVGDMDDLVSAFAGITRSDLVDVRLERVGDDACWKFHRDYVEARLLTTYRGPATEWVHPQHAARALREQKRYKGPVEALRNDDVAIFKGSCAGPGSGIVHRSPPIAGTGHTRLLLCLNKRSEVSPEPWHS